MKKCLLWGTGQTFNSNINLLRYYESLAKIEIVGITSKEYIFDRYLGYKYIPKAEILDIDFDIILIMGVDRTYKEIYKEAIALGVQDEQIIQYKLLGYPWFDFDKYIELKKSNLSIFAQNCWGGITSNLLNMQFKSPFVNMFETEEDFIKISKNPDYYMEQEVEFAYTNYDLNLKNYYPVCKCDDVTLYFNHYTSYEQALECWNRRKKRINWDNIMLMMLTENEDIVERFIELPYKKKVCFTTVKNSNPCVCHVDFKEKMSNIPLWKIVNNTFARQHMGYSNVLDLLLDGKLTYLN